MKTKDQRIRRCDIITWIIVVLVILVHSSSVFLFQMKSSETGASIESVVKVYEANPMLNAKAFTDKIFMITFFLLKPAIVLGVYYIFRRFAQSDKMSIIALEGYTFVLFVVMGLNFLNDVSVLLGIMSNGINIC